MHDNNERDLEKLVEEDKLREAARNGDRQALETLWDKNKMLTEKWLMRQTRSKQDAEDLLSDVYIGFQTSFARCPDFMPASSWILRIASNRIKNYINRDVKRDNYFLPLEEAEKCSIDLLQSKKQTLPYESVVQKDTIDRLHSALIRARTVKAISRKQSDILICKYFITGKSDGDHATDEQIAVVLDLDHRHVRVEAWRGRRKFFAYLYENEPDLLGGTDAIKAACQKLSPQDCKALQSSRHNEAYLDAVMKLIELLPLLAALAVFLGGRA